MEENEQIKNLREENRKLRSKVRMLKARLRGPVWLGSARQIIEKAAKAHGLDPSDIVGASRMRSVVFARSEAAWEARRAGFSYPELGIIFGGRDHTTMMNLVRKAEKRRGPARRVL